MCIITDNIVNARPRCKHSSGAVHAVAHRHSTSRVTVYSQYLPSPGWWEERVDYTQQLVVSDDGSFTTLDPHSLGICRALHGSK